MISGLVLHNIRVEIEEEFLSKFRDSSYATEIDYNELKKALRVLRVQTVNTPTYDVGEGLIKNVEEGVYASVYPLLNKLFIFSDMIQHLSEEALRIMFRHEYLHLFSQLFLNSAVDDILDAHGKHFVDVTEKMGYPTWLASGSIELKQY